MPNTKSAPQARALNCTMAMEHYMAEDMPAVFADEVTAESVTVTATGEIALRPDALARVVLWCVENPGHAREMAHRLKV